eukprot:GILK01006277.1.p1 GENE.GILK01006277.1~~GILK01006277.1.p1  ORF type:complete len:400 (-),score=43.07 GILK01006277.1:269-1468(-)
MLFLSRLCRPSVASAMGAACKASLCRSSMRSVHIGRSIPRHRPWSLLFGGAVATGVAAWASVVYANDVKEETSRLPALRLLPTALTTPKLPSRPFDTNLIADIAEKAMDSVVTVSDASLRGLGTGFIIDDAGIILTNHHVVNHIHGRIFVKLSDGTTMQGTLVGADPGSDLAVIRVQPKSKLTALPLGSGKVRVGEWVISIGHPFTLTNSVSVGIIGGVSRRLTENTPFHPSTDFLQTDAAMNPGVSGGPLINTNGEVVGVCFGKALLADGVGFAVSVHTVKQVVPQLLQHGRVLRPYVGMSIIDITPQIAAEEKRVNKDFPNVDSGVLVTKVSWSTPASKAGFKAGDVVTSINGEPIKTISELHAALGFKVNEPLTVEVKRNNELIQLKLIPEPLKSA